MPDVTNRPVTLLLFLKFNKQGSVAGESTQPEAGGIECLSYELKMTSPRDAATGQASGKRRYEPLLILKRLDQTSPTLAKALATNEVLKEATLKFFRRKPDGTQEQYYTLKIMDGSIASLKSYLPDAATAVGSSQTPVEEVGITFQKIMLTHVSSKNSFEDSIN